MTKDNHAPVRSRRLPFNTAVESGLRTLCILFEAFPDDYDLQRLVFCDYLLVHSGDADDGPQSLHPATPFRSNEFLVRRHLIEDGVRLLTSRGLVQVSITDRGIGYRASDIAGSFLASLHAPYASALKDRAKWVVQRFGHATDSDLSDCFNRNLDRWGSEFEIVGDWDEGGVE